MTGYICMVLVELVLIMALTVRHVCCSFAWQAWYWLRRRDALKAVNRDTAWCAHLGVSLCLGESVPSTLWWIPAQAEAAQADIGAWRALVKFLAVLATVLAS